MYTGHVHNTTVARISLTGFYCASGDVSGTGSSETPFYRELAMNVLIPFKPVKVWDTVGEDKVQKGEYKVLAGKMYVHWLFENETADHSRFSATTSTGMAKAKGLSPSVKVVISQ